jgi:hypothetical protein
VAWLAPWHLDLRYAHIWDRATWDFTSIPERWYLGLGIIVLLGVLGATARAAIAIVRGRASPTDTAIVLVGVYLLTIAAAFTWFRSQTRGLLPYLGVSTYYFYFFSLCLWILLALSVRLSRGAILALVLFEVVPSVFLTQRVLAARRPGVDLVRETNLELQREIPPDGCYAGAVSKAGRRFDPPSAPTVLTGSTSCANGGQRGRSPWVLAERDGFFVVPDRSGVDRRLDSDLRPARARRVPLARRVPGRGRDAHDRSPVSRRSRRRLERRRSGGLRL